MSYMCHIWVIYVIYGSYMGDIGHILVIYGSYMCHICIIYVSFGSYTSHIGHI